MSDDPTLSTIALSWVTLLVRHVSLLDLVDWTSFVTCSDLKIELKGEPSRKEQQQYPEETTIQVRKKSTF